MDTYIVQPISVPTVNGTKEWYCIIRTEDGAEVARSSIKEFANAICALCIAGHVPT
jgi:hypothetical protein